MIFELFIAFIFLALAFIFIGYYTDIKVLALLGFTTIFLLGLTINLSGLTYKTGETMNYSYICTICGSPASSNSSCVGLYNYTGCYGTPNPCAQYTWEQDCLFYGCNYNDLICEGTPSACDTYTNQTDCELAGCEYGEVAGNCSMFDTREDCLTDYGCDYVTTYTNATAGINASVVSSTTTTYDYTALNDSATLWVARWLMIFAFFGFILVIVTNRVRD